MKQLVTSKFLQKNDRENSHQALEESEKTESRVGFLIPSLVRHVTGILPIPTAWSGQSGFAGWRKPLHTLCLVFGQLVGAEIVLMKIVNVKCAENITMNEMIIEERENKKNYDMSKSF